MDFFISDAYAEGGAAAAPAGADLLGLLPLIVIFLIFYFLLIRPQVK
ncbi:MAG: preprotein translocase subunit YajC, partial [Gammaproteobacteria bacterium]|nr:preprotein translocase subunit YajC [Gammaproteobacteria bacterium]